MASPEMASWPPGRRVLTDLELPDQPRQRLRLLRKTVARSSRPFDHRSVLLSHLVDLVGRRVHVRAKSSANSKSVSIIARYIKILIFNLRGLRTWLRPRPFSTATRIYRLLRAHQCRSQDALPDPKAGIYPCWILARFMNNVQVICSISTKRSHSN